ncbi:MAG: S41 family peptidase [Verrucomicrobia bacterium]|nr:S41 family peptidase [Verrucomicrobiota bacterium]
MKKRIFYGLIVAVIGLNLLVGVQIYLNSVQAADKDQAWANIELFTRVMERVRRDYVDADKVSYQDLIRGALKGMLGTLDPHSEFMEPQKYDELKKDTEGAFGGVGIVIGLRDSFLTVIAPIEDSPAFKAGVFGGDRIIKIDGKSTEKFSLADAVKKLRGDPGSAVNVTVLRPSSGQIRDIKLVRAEIKVDSVKDVNGKRDFPIGENKIGYVRLTQFGEKTADDLQRGLKRLDAQGMQALILDLRDNPGGLLDQAVKVCEKFLPNGQLVVSTEGRSAANRQYFRAEGRDKQPDYPMVVLVNGGSASASEIVAGCLQDLKRAIIVGENTFGKGSVQSILPLEDGSALRLTTAKYYTPSHRVIHEKGIKPDIEIPMTLEAEEALAIRRMPGGVDAVDSLDAKKKDFIRNVRDTQLDRAMDLLKGITLYTHRLNHPENVAQN